MTSTGKVILWVVVIILVGAGAWWYFSKGGSMQPQGADQASNTANGQASPAALDTSDAALVNDTTAIDAQMQGLQTDTANVDSSLNDKAIPQQ